MRRSTVRGERKAEIADCVQCEVPTSELKERPRFVFVLGAGENRGLYYQCDRIVCGDLRSGGTDPRSSRRASWLWGEPNRMKTLARMTVEGV